MALERPGVGGVIVSLGMVEAKKSKESVEDAEVTLSSSEEKEKVEKEDKRELGLELSGEDMGSGEESGEGKEVVNLGKKVVGMSMSTMGKRSRVGVGDMIAVLEIIAKSSSSACFSCSDSRSCWARVRLCARATAELTVARRDACIADCCPSLLMGTWGSCSLR